ncbi:MAG: hypothetical protein WCA37_14520, partial [Terracidiphilus sp.]
GMGVSDELDTISQDGPRLSQTTRKGQFEGYSHLGVRIEVKEQGKHPPRVSSVFQIVKFPSPDSIQQVITLPKNRAVLDAREKVVPLGFVVSPVFGREILDFEWD